MTGYIGIKRVEAKPMNLGDYNAYKGDNPRKRGLGYGGLPREVCR